MSSFSLGVDRCYNRIGFAVRCAKTGGARGWGQAARVVQDSVKKSDCSSYITVCIQCLYQSSFWAATFYLSDTNWAEARELWVDLVGWCRAP